MWRRGTGLVDTAANFLLRQEVRQPLITIWKHAIYNPESLLLIGLAFGALFGTVTPSSFSLFSAVVVRQLELQSVSDVTIVIKTVYFIAVSFRGAVVLHRFWFLFDKQTTYRYFIGVLINSLLVLTELMLSILVGNILLIFLSFLALASGFSVRLQWVRNISDDN